MLYQGYCSTVSPAQVSQADEILQNKQSTNSKATDVENILVNPEQLHFISTDHAMFVSCRFLGTSCKIKCLEVNLFFGLFFAFLTFCYLLFQPGL